MPDVWVRRGAMYATLTPRDSFRRRSRHLPYFAGETFSTAKSPCLRRAKPNRWTRLSRERAITHYFRPMPNSSASCVLMALTNKATCLSNALLGSPSRTTAARTALDRSSPAQAA